MEKCTIYAPHSVYCRLIQDSNKIRSNLIFSWYPFDFDISVTLKVYLLLINRFHSNCNTNFIMKLSTSNFKHPDFTGKHQIYVGADTGSLKKFNLEEETPHAPKPFQNIASLSKNAKITALAFDENKTEIMIGTANHFLKVFAVAGESISCNLDMKHGAIVGLACYNEKYVIGFETGDMQNLESPDLISFGDNMSRLRQCSVDRKLIATGGKDRKNNLKIYDLNTNSTVFQSKNVPHDQLQLEVPVWDSDFQFLDAPNKIVTCSRYGYIRLYDTKTQRRPIYNALTEDHSWTCVAARGNLVYVGSTMGALKAYDLRNPKTHCRTYKGFTGSISDLALDDAGQYLVSGSLDRYLRVHNADSCVLTYQCYSKSKITRLVVRDEPYDAAKHNADPDCEFVREEQESDGNGLSSNEDENRNVSLECPRKREGNSPEKKKKRLK